jgi:Flp pilus assembly protein TadB
MTPEVLILLHTVLFAFVAAFIAGMLLRAALIWLDHRRQRKREEALRQSTEDEFRSTLMAEAAQEYGPQGASSISEHIRVTEARERQR